MANIINSPIISIEKEIQQNQDDKTHYETEIENVHQDIEFIKNGIGYHADTDDYQIGLLETK